MQEKKQATLHAHVLRGKPGASREDLESARALQHVRVAPE